MTPYEHTLMTDMGDATDVRQDGPMVTVELFNRHDGEAALVPFSPRELREVIAALTIAANRADDAAKAIVAEVCSPSDFVKSSTSCPDYPPAF